MKHIIYVPGLNDKSSLNNFFIKLLPRFWNSNFIQVHIVYPNWSKGHFQEKLKEIIQEIDGFSSGESVVLMGQSAGVSAVLNAFARRKSKINNVICICGRVRAGKQVFPSLTFAAKGNIAFKESIDLFEKEVEQKLTEKDKEKILILRPFWDDIVPSSTAKIDGVKMIIMPVIGHMLGGFTAFLFYGKVLRRFL